MFPIEESPRHLTDDLSVLIELDSGPQIEDLIFKLKTVLENHRGDTPVFLVMRNENDEKVVIQVGRESTIPWRSGTCAISMWVHWSLGVASPRARGTTSTTCSSSGSRSEFLAIHVASLRLTTKVSHMLRLLADSRRKRGFPLVSFSNRCPGRQWMGRS